MVRGSIAFYSCSPNHDEDICGIFIFTSFCRFGSYSLAIRSTAQGVLMPFAKRKKKPPATQTDAARLQEVIKQLAEVA